MPWHWMAQATMPSPPPTARPYMVGVYIAYLITSWCYFGVAFAVRQLRLTTSVHHRTARAPVIVQPLCQLHCSITHPEPCHVHEVR